VSTAADLEVVLAIARDAAAIVMRVYATPFAVEYKGPSDPVTLADREANALICERLSRAFPGVPIVAEESDPSTFTGAMNAPQAWFVDPLDGTREFVAKNGEFAVMIGLAEQGRATSGVLVCPALGRSFLGAVGHGAFEIARDGSRRAIHVSDTAKMSEATVVVSRSHRPEHLDAILEALGAGSVVPTGSAGVKAAKIAAGEADVYMQPGRAGKRWDACGPEAIVRAAGGIVTDVRGDAFEYASGALDNDLGFVATNARLHDAVLRAFAIAWTKHQESSPK
jgi:3'(2'), 5'-bisphosphate nucleotidase